MSTFHVGQQEDKEEESGVRTKFASRGRRFLETNTCVVDVDHNHKKVE